MIHENPSHVTGSPYGSSSNMFKSNKVADSEKVPPPPPLFIGGLKREAHIGDFGSPLPPVAAETGFPPGMMRREKHIFSLQVGEMKGKLKKKGGNEVF